MVGSVPMAIIGPTEAKVTPIMTGMRIPNFQMPNAWMSVARPAANKSALIRKAICSLGRCSAPPTMSGTATVPAYITNTCCNPNASRRPYATRSLVKSAVGAAMVLLVMKVSFGWSAGRASGLWRPASVVPARPIQQNRS